MTPVVLPPGPVIVGLAGFELGPDDAELLRHPMTGGVILFERNVADAAQLGALTAAVHALRHPPLLVTVDQEGGRVQRLRRVCTELPSARALGAAHDADPAHGRALAHATGLVLAADCRSLGVDLAYAPVLDLDHGVSAVIGARALHRDPQVVTALARALIEGMAQAGMAAVGKHYPGHGGVAPDTHHAAAVDARSRDALAPDLTPYRALAGVLGGVMLAHVVYPALDAMAAGYSRRWIGEVLRGELGFAGAAISDDLGMAGGAAPGGLAARAQAALDAGCDYVLLCNALDAAPQVLDVLRWTPPAAHRARHARLQGDAGVRPAAAAYARACAMLDAL